MRGSWGLAVLITAAGCAPASHTSAGPAAASPRAAPAAAPAPVPPPPDAVALVNDAAITQAEFDREVERNLARYRGQGTSLPPGVEQRIKESVLRRMIDDKIIAGKASELGISLPEADLNKSFAEHKARFRTEQAFDDYLRRSGNTEDNMRRDLASNLLRDRVVETLAGQLTLTDDEVAAYYTENQARFTEKEQIRAGRILIRVDPQANAGKKRTARQYAVTLRGKLTQGADFAELARKRSQGPEAERGGELGWLSRGRMPPEFDNAAFALEAGAISDVVETTHGFEVIKVWEKKPERPRPLEEVAESIRNSLVARKRNDGRRDVLRSLKDGARVEVLIRLEAVGAAGPR